MDIVSKILPLAYILLVLLGIFLFVAIISAIISINKIPTELEEIKKVLKEQQKH